jgi:ribonuclease HII
VVITRLLLANDLPIEAIIGGVDEAGRGALAGPVVACCVVFGESVPCMDELADSKQLSEGRRSVLFEAIRPHIYLGVGLASPRCVERMNVFQATLMAMAQAIHRVKAPMDHVIIDGNAVPKTPIPCTALIKADACVSVVMAASICAKVIRDRIMIRYHHRYPNYDFAGHKGYPTAGHYQALAALGPLAIHRKTFRLINK